MSVDSGANDIPNDESSTEPVAPNIAASAIAKLHPNHAQLLTDAAAELDVSTPRLSPEQVKQIADQVAEQIIDIYGAHIQQSKRGEMQRKLASAAYQIGLGVAGSAVWTLLAYLAHVFVYADSDSPEMAQHKAEQLASQRKTTSRLSPATNEKFRAFEKALGGHMLNVSIGDSMASAAKEDPSFLEVVKHIDELALLRGRAQQTLSARLRSALGIRKTQGPAVVGEPLPDEIAALMAKLVFASLKRAAADAAG